MTIPHNLVILAEDLNSLVHRINALPATIRLTNVLINVLDARDEVRAAIADLGREDLVRQDILLPA